MTNLPYSCDPEKAASNLKEHLVSFDDGFRVLMQDAFVLWEFFDGRDEYGEDRWITIGPLPHFLHTLLHVTWTEREGIHLISVRRVTTAERQAYGKRHHRSR